MIRPKATTPGKSLAAVMLVSRMTVARRVSCRSWVAGSRRCTTERLPPRAKRRSAKSNSLLWFCLSASAKSAPRASTAVAKGRLQCSASPVTMQPSSESIRSTSSAPATSLRPGALREANAKRASLANTPTRCIGVAALPRS